MVRNSRWARRRSAAWRRSSARRISWASGRERGLAHRDGLAEGTGLAHQGGHEVPEVGAERAFGQCPRPNGHARRRAPDLHLVGEGSQPELGAGEADRHRVAAALEGAECLLAGADWVAGAGEEWTLRQRAEQRSLFGEARADGLVLALANALLLSGLPGQEGVELVQVDDGEYRDQIVVPAITDKAFDKALLVGLARGAVVSAEAVGALQRQELLAGRERSLTERSQPAGVVVAHITSRVE
jgi:hypothetical protein